MSEVDVLLMSGEAPSAPILELMEQLQREGWRCAIDEPVMSCLLLICDLPRGRDYSVAVESAVTIELGRQFPRPETLPEALRLSGLLTELLSFSSRQRDEEEPRLQKAKAALQEQLLLRITSLQLCARRFELFRHLVVLALQRLQQSAVG